MYGSVPSIPTNIFPACSPQVGSDPNKLVKLRSIHSAGLRPHRHGRKQPGSSYCIRVYRGQSRHTGPSSEQRAEAIRIHHVCIHVHIEKRTSKARVLRITTTHQRRQRRPLAVGGRENEEPCRCGEFRTVHLLYTMKFSPSADAAVDETKRAVERAVAAGDF